jgi:hypothetical protein
MGGSGRRPVVPGEDVRRVGFGAGVVGSCSLVILVPDP